MAGADRPGVDDAAGEGFEHRPGALDRLGVAADHHVERAFPGVLGGAAQRRVDQRDFLRRERLGEAPRRSGLEVEQSTIEQRLSRRGEPVRPLNDRLDLRRTGDAEDDDVAGVGDRARGRRFLGAARLQVVDRLALAVGEDGQRPALLDDVLRHAVAHEPDADEADAFFHVRFPRANLARCCLVAPCRHDLVLGRSGLARAQADRVASSRVRLQAQAFALCFRSNHAPGAGTSPWRSMISFIFAGSGAPPRQSAAISRK